MSWTIIDVAIGQGSGGGGGGTTDNTTEGFIPVKQSGAFNNSAVSEDATNINVSKPIIAPSITVDAGTLHVGVQAISAGGESIFVTNEADGEIFYSVAIKDGENIPRARKTVGSKDELEQESSKADILIDPSWISNPVVDWRVVELTFESDTTIDNVVFTVTRDGEEFAKSLIGTLPANIETTFDLRDIKDVTPLDAFEGGDYEVSLTSEDGPVRLKGSTANLLPFFRVGYFSFEDRVVLDDQSSDFGDIEKTMTLKSNGPASYDQATGELILIPYQDLVTSNQTIASVVQPVTAQLSSSYITGIEIGYLFAQTDVRITVETAGGDVTFLTDVISGVTLVKLPEPLKLQPLEVYQFTVDNSLTVGGDAIMGGIMTAQFDIFYQIEVEVIKTRNLDPDQRIQNRTIQMPLTQIGYEAQSGGGILADQGWTDESTGTATLVPQIDPADGGLSLKSLDNTSGGLTKASRPIDSDPASAMQRIFDNGGWIGFELRAESQSSNISASAGLGFSAASDPGYKGGTRGRWLFNSGLTTEGNQAVTPEGGTAIDTGVPAGGYVYVGVSVTAGTMVGDIYVNGNKVFDGFDFSVPVSNANYDDLIVYGSGGTSSTGRINWMRRADLVIFDSGPSLPFSKRLIEDNTIGILPVNVYRDWFLTFLDVEVERKSTGTLYLPNWGTLTLGRVGDEVTFNGRDGMIIQGPGSIEVSQINLDDAAPNKKYQVSFFGDASEIRDIDKYVADRKRGYGGIEQLSSVGMSDIDTTPQTLSSSNGSVSTPKNIIQNPVNNTVTALVSGIWNASIAFDLAFDDSVSGRQIQVEVYNVTDDTQVLLATISVGRNQGGINAGATLMLEVTDTAVDDELSVRVSSLADTFTSVNLTGYSFSMTLVEAI